VCVCRYATKADTPADVVLDTETARRLGFNGNEKMLQLLSSMVLAKTVSPCEAATILAGYQVLDKTCTVVHIPTYMSIDHYDVYGMYSWSVACEAVREHS
jgi:hypothetical protein